MKNGKNGSNTTKKLLGGCTGNGFKPGFDPKRNLKGRPRSFDEVRALAQSLAHEKQQGREAIINVLLRWRDSPEPSLQRAFVEYAFGKVPDKIETTGLENKTTLILNYADERQTKDRSRLSPTVSQGTE